MELFDRIERTDSSPSSHGEDGFSFLNRVRSPAADRIRIELQDWFDRYPQAERENLRKRFRTEFESAFFELLLHQLLVKLGGAVEVHPELSPDSDRPDFLVSDLGYAPLVVEARVVTNMSEKEAARRARLGTLYDLINEYESSNFFLSLDEISNPQGLQPKWARLRAFLDRKLSPLNPDELTRVITEQGLDALPVLDFVDPEGDPNAFRLRARPLPKSKGARGIPGLRTIGVYPAEFSMGGSAPAIRSALRKKLRRYDVSGRAFMIALNLDPWDNDRIDLMEALYGAEQIIIGPGPTVEGMQRAPDGIWRGAEGWRYRELSAVLVMSTGPYEIQSARIRLYRHPDPEVAVPEALEALPQAIPQLAEGKIDLRDGHGLGTILDLDSEWPGRLFGE